MAGREKLEARGPVKLAICLFILVALTLAPFLLLEPHGWTEIEPWQKVLDTFSQPFIKAVAIILLMALDLVLPIPSIPLLLMSGHQLGVVLGFVVNLFALTLAHTMAYEICRAGGLKAYQRFIGKNVHQASSAFIEKYGPPALVVSRNIPLLSEVFSALAGLSAMARWRFHSSIFFSNFPTAITLAWLGENGNTTLMLTVSMGLIIFPLFLFLVFAWTGDRLNLRD